MTTVLCGSTRDEPAPRRSNSMGKCDAGVADPSAAPAGSTRVARRPVDEQVRERRFSANLQDHMATLHRQARRRAGGHDDLADDLVQETLLRAWASRDRFAEGTNLGAWLFTILRNTHISHIRKRSREQVGFDKEWANSIGVPSNQEDHVALREVMTAMDGLASWDRDIIVAATIEERSHMDIAISCGCALGTVRSRLSRARRRLADAVL